MGQQEGGVKRAGEAGRTVPTERAKSEPRPYNCALCLETASAGDQVKTRP